MMRPPVALGRRVLRHGLGEILSAACALVWAVAVILFRRSGDHTPPVALNFFKVMVGLVLALLTLPFTSSLSLMNQYPAMDWLVLVASGVVGMGVADSLFFAGLNRIGAGRTAVLDSLYSPAVILWSFMLLDEPIGPAILLAMALMAFATALGSTGARGTRHGDLKVGVVLGLIAILLMALSVVFAKPVLDRWDAWLATTVRLAGGASFLCAQAFLPRYRQDTLRILRPGPAWRHALLGSVLGSYVAMFLWIFGLKYTWTTTASVLNQTSNLWIILFASIFLREPLGPRQYAAVLLGFGAAWLAAAAGG